MSKVKKIFDDEIILSADLEDNSQMEALIRQYYCLVEIAALKYLNSPMERDDVVQEGIIGLIAAIKSYDKSKGVPFRAYALVCIRNSIQTSLRKYYRLKDIPPQNMIEYQENDVVNFQSTVSAEEAFLAKERTANLNMLLKEILSDFEFEVLYLYYFAGYKYKEIAKRLHTTPKAIDNALYRIRRKLLTTIKDQVTNLSEDNK